MIYEYYNYCDSLRCLSRLWNVWCRKRHSCRLLWKTKTQRLKPLLSLFFLPPPPLPLDPPVITVFFFTASIMDFYTCMYKETRYYISWETLIEELLLFHLTRVKLIWVVWNYHYPRWHHLCRQSKVAGFTCEYTLGWKHRKKHMWSNLVEFVCWLWNRCDLQCN